MHEEADVFSVIFKVDNEEAEDMSVSVSDDLIIGEGRNIDEAFASIQSQIELYYPDLPWKLASIKYYKTKQK
ncbi:MAG: hypothetical protein ACYC7L_17160 [Nitrospirota bacterium]